MTPAPTPCAQPQPGVCSDPIDLAFLIDGSSSVQPTDFVTAKNFIKSVARLVNVSHTSSRVSVTQFSSSQLLELAFNAGTTDAAIELAVNEMAQLTGGTRTSSRPTSSALDFTP